jgi:hypothetical protein
MVVIYNKLMDLFGGPFYTPLFKGYDTEKREEGIRLLNFLY